jgi:hypothetical protein
MGFGTDPTVFGINQGRQLSSVLSGEKKVCCTPKEYQRIS